MTRLADLYDEYGILIVPEKQAPPGWRSEYGTHPGYARFCFDVSFNTPLVAKVDYFVWENDLAAIGTERLAFCFFGFWFIGPPTSTWVS